MTDSGEKVALLIIDMINDFKFEHGSLLAQKSEEIVTPILQLKETLSEQGSPVIYINDHYNVRQADYNKILQHCTNSMSQSIIGKIAPHEDDYFIVKPKHSAFYGTSLDDLLHQLNIDSLIITGIAGNICVLFTANDAYMREYNLIIPNDCITSVDQDDQQFALRLMENVLKADIRNSSDILKK
ncbi:isochorismatase family cysteine hydrolase [Litchfieldia salsa]|uniref:Nicotinamidase-related amidase n=1 Tax=Litchfieldia salsa TaxID=930152 RepID=A0A1H0X3Q3_9BACI|nr:isochorismatase family cysteine hydrolase [Litchfieldia salsa]SDP97096.1 Nicotinamidase-related amidase [Litchfieldia salsa]